MEKVTLNAIYRDKGGKGTARSLRREGSLPGVIYRAGKAQPLTLNTREAMHFLRATHGDKVLVNLQFQGNEGKLALLKDFQRDPVRGDLLHVDFQEVALDEKIKVTVKVVTVGEPISVKRDGAIFQTILREVEIECLPDLIPGHAEVDVSGMTMGHTVHVGDLKFADGIKVLTDAHEAIATLSMPAAAVEAAPVAEGEPAAPEVVKKGKKTEEAEG